MVPCDLDHDQPDIFLTPDAYASAGELRLVEDRDRGIGMVENGAQRRERQGADACLEGELRFIDRTPFVIDQGQAETLGLCAQKVA